MTREEWLAGLKVGDEVDAGQSIRKVTRATPSQIVVALRGGVEVRFNRNDGRERGQRSSWSRRLRLHPVTDENREKYEHRDLAEWLGHVPYEKLTLVQLRAMRALLKPAQTGDAP